MFKSKLRFFAIIFPIVSFLCLALAFDSYKPGYWTHKNPALPHNILLAIDSGYTMQAQDLSNSYFDKARLFSEHLVNEIPNTFFGLVHFDQMVRPKSIQTYNKKYLIQKLQEKTLFSNQSNSLLQHVFDYANLYFNKLPYSKRWLVILSSGHLNFSTQIEQKIRLFKINTIYVNVAQDSPAFIIADGNTTSPELIPISSKTESFYKLASFSNSHYIKAKTPSELSEKVTNLLFAKNQTYKYAAYSSKFYLLLLISLLCYFSWLTVIYRIFPKKLILITCCLLGFSSLLRAASIELYSQENPDYLSLKIDIPIEAEQKLIPLNKNIYAPHLEVENMSQYLSILDDKDLSQAFHTIIFNIPKPITALNLWLPSVNLSYGDRDIKLEKKLFKLSTVKQVFNFPNAENLELPYYFYFDVDVEKAPFFENSPIDFSYYFLKRSATWKHLFIDLDPFKDKGILKFCPKKSFQEQYSLIYYKLKILCFRSSLTEQSISTQAWMQNNAKENYLSKSSSNKINRLAIPKPIPEHFAGISSKLDINISYPSNPVSPQKYFIIHADLKGENAAKIKSLQLEENDTISLKQLKKNILAPNHVQLVYVAKIITKPFKAISFFTIVFNTLDNSYQKIISSGPELRITSSQVLQQKNQNPSVLNSIHQIQKLDFYYLVSFLSIVSLALIIIWRRYLK